MKKLLLILIASLSLNSLHAQAPITLESPELEQRVFDQAFIPKVRGKLLNFSKEEDPDLFIKYVMVVLESGMQETKTTQIDSDGNFKLTLTNALPHQQIWLSIGDYYYGEILANKDLTITADIQKLKKESVSFYGEGISFSGEDGELNTLVNKRVLYERDKTSELQNEKQMIKRDKKEDISVKEEKIRKIYKGLSELDQAFLAENPSSFAWVLENERLSELYAELFLLFWGTEISPEIMQEGLTHKPALISNSSNAYYSYLDMVFRHPGKDGNIEINQKVLESLGDDKEQKQEIKGFLEEYKKKSAGEPYNENTYKSGLKFFKLFEADFQKARTKRYLDRVAQLPQKTADLVKIIGEPEDLYQRKSYLEEALPTIQTDWCKEIMEKNLTEDLARIAKIESALKNTTKLSENHSLGENLLNPKENIHLYVSSAEDVDGVLASVTNTFHDKTVILDIWATWCSPCISDMKRSGPIKKELKELPVEIVYICVEDGSDLDKWKRKVVELDLKGTHIFLNKKLSSELMQKFNLRGFPSYLFIDKDRNIDQNFIQWISRIDIEELKKRL